MLNLDVRKWAIQNFPYLISEDLTDLEIMYRLLGEINRMSVRIDQLPEEVQTAVNNWINEHPEFYTRVGDGTITFSKLSTEVLNKVNSVDELRRDVTENHNNIEVQANRIDQITQLPSGSTAGDAELMDIRNTFDGFTKAAAGSAVRYGDEKNHDDLRASQEGYINIGDLIANKIYDRSGNLMTLEGYSATELLEIPAKMKTLEFVDFGTMLPQCCSFFDADKHHLSTFETARLGPGVVAIPEEAVYFALSSTDTAMSAFTKIYTYNEYILRSKVNRYKGWFNDPNSTDVRITGYWVLVGDSYCVGYTPSGNVQGWGELLADRLNTNKVIIKGLGGSGFRAFGQDGESWKNWQNLLEEVKNDPLLPNPESVRGIVFAGGYNELWYDISQLPDALKGVMKYATANFPNAEIYTAMIGHDRNADKQIRFINEVAPIYRNTAGRYLTGCEYILTDAMMSSDGVHPMQDGYIALADGLYTAITAGAFVPQPSSDYIPAVNDVRINSQSIINSENVANIPLAGGDYGLTRYKPDYGIKIDENYVKINSAVNSQIRERTNVYRPLTPQNIDLAVNVALTDPKMEWTEEQQAAAKDTLGITEPDIEAGVKTALTTPSAAWTEEQQAAAKDTLGITEGGAKEWEEVAHITAYGTYYDITADLTDKHELLIKGTYTRPSSTAATQIVLQNPDESTILSTLIATTATSVQQDREIICKLNDLVDCMIGFWCYRNTSVTSVIPASYGVTGSFKHKIKDIKRIMIGNVNTTTSTVPPDVHVYVR